MRGSDNRRLPSGTRTVRLCVTGPVGGNSADRGVRCRQTGSRIQKRVPPPLRGSNPIDPSRRAQWADAAKAVIGQAPGPRPTVGPILGG